MEYHYFLHINKWGPIVFGPYTSRADMTGVMAQEASIQPDDEVFSLTVSATTGEIEIETEITSDFMEAE